MFEYFLFHFRHKVIDFAKLDDLQQRTLSPSFKGAVFNYLTTVQYINSQNSRNFSYNILNEALLINEIVFYFTKNFFLVDEINFSLSHLKSGGFINFLRSKYLSKTFQSNYLFKSSLNLRQLGGVFKILLYGWLISCCMFFLEVVFKRAMLKLSKTSVQKLKPMSESIK